MNLGAGVTSVEPAALVFGTQTGRVADVRATPRLLGASVQ